MDKKALTISLLIAILLSVIATVVLETVAAGWTDDHPLLFGLLLGGSLGVIYPTIAGLRHRQRSVD